MKVRTGKFRRVFELSKEDWLASPIWEVKLRFDDYWARPIHEPTRVTRELLRGRQIVVLLRCEQFDRRALAEVRSLRQLGDISVFWRGRQRLNRIAAAKFPFYAVVIPAFGRDCDVRFVWRTKRSRCAPRAS